MNIHSETSRIRAVLVNSGRYSFEEAEKKLDSSRLAIRIGWEAAATPAGQAAALTAVATAVRCFLGGVILKGAVDHPLLIPLPLNVNTLGEAARLLGAVAKLRKSPSRTIIIGSGEHGYRGWAIRAIWNGWSAGIMSAGEGEGYVGSGDISLAGAAAGALAAGHAFFAEQDNHCAGLSMQGLSLWAPGERYGWWENKGPSEYYVPNALWLIGLGNLGQAYLWAISLLPYADPSSIELFFQDDDLIEEENWGTSILAKKGRYGDLKTRIAEEWAENCGYRSRRIDRKLDNHLRRTDYEPGIALAGLDRMEPRRLLGRPGFEYVIDTGLGASARDYDRFRLNIFDRSHDPASHFAGVEDATELNRKEIIRLPAYQEIMVSEKHGCGMAELAGKSVAVPFVSVFVTCLAVAQAIRIASNQAPYIAISGELRDLRSIRAVLGLISDRMVVGYTNITNKMA